MVEKITLSTRELAKLKVLAALVAKQITNKQASKRLGLSVRQIQRLKQEYLKDGDRAVIHKSRNRPSGRGYGEDLRQKIVTLYKEEYSGWNFCHFNDTLEDVHHIKLSDHYVYALLTAHGIKSPRAKKHRCRKHPPRDRKENAGELLQADASMHLWIILGDQKYALHGMIDDATGIVTALVLCDEETNMGYQIALADTIKRYGIPACLYTDYRTVFQTNKKLTIEDELEGKELEATRFAKMCERLGVGIISTRVAQAKGRVERLWETLQDRLTKELLKANITTKKEANEYINNVFLPHYNARFASEIDYTKNLFVKVPEDFDYNTELALPIERTALHGCYIKLNNQTYSITEENGDTANFISTTKLTVFTCLDGTCYAEHNHAHYILTPILLPTHTKSIMTPKTSEEISKIRSAVAKKNLSSPWRKYYAHAPKTRRGDIFTNQNG